MTPQSSDATRFIDGLPNEKFGHECLRECEEHLRPETIFQLIDGPAGWSRALWTEVYTLNEYDVPGSLPGDAVIVDVGAHVGAFARLCIRRGAGHVFCVEPLGQNLDALRYNLGDVGERVTVIPRAIWGGEPRETLSIGRSRVDVPGNTSTATYLSDHDAEIFPTIDVDELIEQAAASAPSGRIYQMKFDCEGAEFPALYNAKRLDLVDRICGETHGDPDAIDRGESPAVQLLDHLRGRGFSVEWRRNGPCTLIFQARRE